MPEYFWQKTPSGELEFAVPGWDVTSVDYLVALAMHKAPLSPKLTLRRISSRLANPRSTYVINKYLAERGDARVKDWASWVKNAKFENDEQRAAAVNAAVGKRDPRADPNGISYLKMQSALRMVILKVMYENGIDVFVNPEQTTAPYKLGYAGEPEVNDRPQISCCTAFTALGGMPEMDVPAGFTTISYDSQYELNADKNDYVEVTGQVESKMPPMPVSMMFWSGPGSDAAVIKAGSAYESATHHRKPPPAFGPVPARPSRADVREPAMTAFLRTVAVLSVLAPAAGTAGAQTLFRIEESTIADVQNAIKSGQTTCRAVVQAYLDRAKAYNGTCTALGDGRWRADPSREGRGARRRAHHLSHEHRPAWRRCFPISASTRAGPSSSDAWSQRSPTRACSSSSACASASRMRGRSTRSRRSTSAASARSPARAITIGRRRPARCHPARRPRAKRSGSSRTHSSAPRSWTRNTAATPI